MRTLSASKEFDSIHIIGQSREISKLTFEVKYGNPAFFEGHWYKNDSMKYGCIYLSSHSGCPVGCRMCGTNGYHVREATVEEIVGQFEFMHRKMLPCAGGEEEFQTLVIKFLYMGEPLLNLANVDAALRCLAVKYPKWKVLVSTIGPRIDYQVVKNWIRDFGKRIAISFSIHKIDDIERNNLIPFKDKLTIDEIVEMGSSIAALERSYKLEFSFNLFNRQLEDKTAQKLAQTFNPDIWKACVQFLYDKNGREAPEYEQQCNEIVHKATLTLERNGFEALGFYAPVTSGDSHLITGCGQFVEFQKYVKGNNITRIA